MLNLYQGLPVYNKLLDTLRTLKPLMLRVANNPGVPYWIENNGELVDFYPGSSIFGVFQKQVWGGHKNDTAIPVSRETFNATAHVLFNLSLEQLHALQDSMYTTDEIGLAHVGWDGPHDVELVQSVLEYFGAQALTDITQTHLDCARRFFERNHPELVQAQKERTHQIEQELKSKGAQVFVGEQARTQMIQCLHAFFDEKSQGKAYLLSQDSNGRLDMVPLAGCGAEALVGQLTQAQGQLDDDCVMVMIDSTTDAGHAYKATYLPKSQVLTVIDETAMTSV